MGVMKQLDVEFQEAEAAAVRRGQDEVADTIAWYRAHFDKLPPELMRAILTDEDFFQKALTVWDNQVFAPKPASSHVALQEPLVSRRSLREKRGPSWQCIVGWSLIASALIASAVILAVSL